MVVEHRPGGGGGGIDLGNHMKASLGNIDLGEYRGIGGT